jgi:hypothetical protein
MAEREELCVALTLRGVGEPTRLLELCRKYGQSELGLQRLGLGFSGTHKPAQVGCWGGGSLE